MGKRYYCDYCNKTMDSSYLVVKKHNQGLLHQKSMREHYQQYKDPEVLLMEESNKKPCNRFMKGECHFGILCHYSHYTQEQIMALRQIVSTKKANESEFTQPSFQELYHKLQVQKQAKTQNTDDGTTVVYDSNGVTHVLPWIYNEEFEFYGNNLPPSLRKIRVEDFVNVEIPEWG